MEPGDGVAAVLLHDHGLVPLRVVVRQVVGNSLRHVLSNHRVLVPFDVGVHVHEVRKLELTKTKKTVSYRLTRQNENELGFFTHDIVSVEHAEGHEGERSCVVHLSALRKQFSIKIKKNYILIYQRL